VDIPAKRSGKSVYVVQSVSTFLAGPNFPGLLEKHAMVIDLRTQTYDVDCGPLIYRGRFTT
jgi:hypothetical protein